MTSAIDILAFAEQRPGFEPGNYGTWRDYRNESARVTRQLHDVRALARYCTLRHIDVTLPASGRLTVGQDGLLDYCAGQYWCVEYRDAAARALASAIWDYLRECSRKARGGAFAGTENVTGDDIRSAARRKLGATLARRYFA